MSAAYQRVVLLLAAIFVGAIQAESQCQLPLFTNSKAMLMGVRSFSEGDKVLITCTTGNTLAAPQTGNNYTTTCRSGQWMPQHNCVVVKCLGLPTVEHGVVVSASTTEPPDGRTYRFGAELRVYCQGGRFTADGRQTYQVTCNMNGAWAHTYPCSVPPNYGTASQVYHTSAVLTGFPYIRAYGDPDSAIYMDTVAAYSRALFGPLANEFDLFVKVANITFRPMGTSKTIVEFDLFFKDAMNADADKVAVQLGAAIASNNKLLTDSATGRKFTFETTKFQVSKIKSGFHISMLSTVSLAIGGALVAVLALTLACVCVACRKQQKTWMGTKNPYQREVGASNPWNSDYNIPRTTIY